MNQTERAEAAVFLLRHAMESDNKNAVDLMAGMIEAEGLYRLYGNDAGPFTSFADFAAELNSEIEDDEAPSGSRPLCQLSAAERHQRRLAQFASK